MLRDNPFYVLNIPMSASRGEISAKIEELSLFLDVAICDEAQSCLANPAKRIEAEIDWFPGESEETIVAIREAIAEGRDIDGKNLRVNGMLNAAIDSLERQKLDAKSLAKSINTIDVYFEINDPEELLMDINRERLKAGVPQTDLQSVKTQLSKVRAKIKTAITEKFAEIDDEEYVKTVTAIAEACFSKQNLSHGNIIDDVIDQYELRMQPIVEEQTKKVISFIERIKNANDEVRRGALIDPFINLLRQWDSYAQPIQLRTQAEGTTHAKSKEIAYLCRELAIELNNRYQDARNSKKIIDALIEVFKELPEEHEVLKDDQQILRENVRVAKGTNYGEYRQAVENKISVDIPGEKSGTNAITLALIALMAVICIGGIGGFISYHSTTHYGSIHNNSYNSSSNSSSTTLVEKEMPENEHKFTNKFGESIKGRPSNINIENNTDYGFVVKLVNVNSGRTAFSFFSRPYSKTPMHMGLGNYYVKWAAGKKWYGTNNMFGPNTIYYFDNEPCLFTVEQGWTYTFTPEFMSAISSNTDAFGAY